MCCPHVKGQAPDRPLHCCSHKGHTDNIEWQQHKISFGKDAERMNKRSMDSMCSETHFRHLLLHTPPPTPTSDPHLRPTPSTPTPTSNPRLPAHLATYSYTLCLWSPPPTQPRHLHHKPHLHPLLVTPDSNPVYDPVSSPTPQTPPPAPATDLFTTQSHHLLHTTPTVLTLDPRLRPRLLLLANFLPW